MCAQYILAQGVFTPDSPKALSGLLQSIEWQPAVFFDSPGGDLAAALEVGHLIRKKMLTTYIGSNYEVVGRNPELPSVVVVPVGQCFSACVYAFLGGSTRVLDTAGQLGVHQFSGATKDVGESAAQSGVAVLSQYVDEMGVDRGLLDLAASAPPDSIRLIPQHVAYSLNVDNTKPPLVPWKIEADDDGHLRVEATQRHAGRDAVTSLLFYRTDGVSTRVAVIYRVHQVFRSAENVLSILNDVESWPVLQGGGRTAELTPLEPWQPVQSGAFIRSFKVSHGALKALAASSSIEFYISFPNCCVDVSPSVAFGSVGLLRGLRALEK